MVWIPKPPDPPFRETLERCLDPRWRVYFGADCGGDPCDVLVAGRPTAEQIGPSVRAVIVPFAGIPATTRSLLREHPEVSLHNLHHNAAPTAEMAVGLLLAAAKRVVPADRALRRGDWMMRYEHDHALLLEGRTAVVVGYGAIGGRIATSCLALGMAVHAVSRTGASDSKDDRITLHSPAALDGLLHKANALILAVPATAETDGLIGARELRQLPQRAVVINVSRGAVIDEGALYEALGGGLTEGAEDGAGGRLHGAGLDVWWRYPEDEGARGSTPPSEFDFGALDNVVLSPHRAGHGDATERLRAEHLATLLNEAEGVESLGNRVHVPLGY